MIVSVQPFVHGTFVLKIESGYKMGQFVSKPKLKDTDIEFPVTFGTEASALKWAIETGYQIFKYHDEVLPTEEKKKLDTNDYKILHAALQKIMEGERNEDYGICYNLQSKVLNCIEKRFIYQFLQESLKSILGGKCGQYPIEGSYEDFKRNNEKWNTFTEFGFKRLNLLKSMIERTEKLSLGEK
ncbi:hypothetical protein RCIP0023_00180 [Klebsiella phage RCIP0023]|nr:hypothetical protein CPT_Muenster_525 [Klebsiella phage Muenster]